MELEAVYKARLQSDAKEIVVNAEATRNQTERLLTAEKWIRCASNAIPTLDHHT